MPFKLQIMITMREEKKKCIYIHQYGDITAGTEGQNTQHIQS